MFKKLNIKRLNKNKDEKIEQKEKVQIINKQYSLTDNQYNYENYCGECINFNHFTKKCDSYNITVNPSDISCTRNFKSIYQ